jgi:general secretion pathway protein G
MRRGGFTLIEMLVVMAIMATLLAIAAPRYFDSMERAKETALRSDLRIMREALDKFHADTGTWPRELQNLVSARYLRELPVDPVTGAATTWQANGNPDGSTPGVYDVHSGASGIAHDGTAYSTW